MNPSAFFDDRLYEAPSCMVITMSGRDTILLELSKYGEQGEAGDGFGGDNPIIPGGSF